MWWFWGIQMPPPETAVVPPTDEVRSTTVTRAPLSWAVMAAVRAATPVPTTTTSVAAIGEGGSVGGTVASPTPRRGQVAVELAVHLGDAGLVGV
jgi:hypothetical protein